MTTKAVPPSLDERQGAGAMTTKVVRNSLDEQRRAGTMTTKAAPPSLDDRRGAKAMTTKAVPPQNMIENPPKTQAPFPIRFSFFTTSQHNR